MAQTLRKSAGELLAAAQTRISQALAQPESQLAAMPLPAVALKVTNLSLEDTDAAQLAALIQKDAGLASEIVRVANSALYARRMPVTALPQAIAWLGMSEVRKLAVACALRAQLFANPVCAQALEPIWSESLATACFAQEIARLRRRAVEPAYLCGLLHRCGFSALVQFLARDPSLQPLLADAAALVQLAAEFEIALAGRLTNTWALAESIAKPVLHWRDAAAAATGHLPRGLQLSLHEVVLARAMAAHLANKDIATEDDLPPEIVGAVMASTDLLGLYQDDLHALWSRREAVHSAIESLR
jgi:HD-like signal output (HDOD) protein